MKKKILYAIVFAAAIITGYSAYNEYGGTKLSGALLANVEALSQGEVANGYVMKINPMYSKTCYMSYVDAEKYRIIRMYSEDYGYYDYKEYYHSYRTYTASNCEVMDIIKAPGWWEDCPMPKQAECRVGDADRRPEPYEFWQ